MTARYLTGSLHEAMKKTFADADITFPQVLFWVQFFVNKFSAQRQVVADSGMYLSIFSDVPVLTATANSNPNIVAGRKYFVLPAQIMDFNDDRGIDYISYPDFEGACQPSFAGVKFTVITPTQAKRIYMSPYEEPGSKNPYAYRIGDYVYLLGIECIDVPLLEMGLRTVFNPFTECNLDSNIPLSEALIADVYKNVLEIGRFVMLIPSDTVNEGKDTVSPENPPSQRLVSVNQPGVPIVQPQEETQ